MNGKILFINMRGDFCAATAGEESSCQRLLFARHYSSAVIFVNLNWGILRSG